MDRDDEPKLEQSAEELTRLAGDARNPATRIWCLEWARAFRKLAALSPPSDPPPSPPKR